MVASADARRPDRPSREERQACQAECVDLRKDCGRACRAEAADCLRPAREEARSCRAICDEDFEAESEELELCKEDCNTEIFAPAREACLAARKECRSTCFPGQCQADCRINGGTPDPCRAECGSELRACAQEGKAELRTCVGEAECRALEGEEREDCVAGCTGPAREAHAACKDTFTTCVEVCAADEETPAEE
jgi:hypothetical protein